MAFLKWPDKDPDEVLDYLLTWDDWLVEGDVIASSTWTVPAGLTKGADSHDDDSCTVWLSGGTLAAPGEPATKYTLTNRIVTDDGRTADRSVTIKIKAK